MNIPIYNQIGKGYNTTRCADPYLTSRIIAQLQPRVGKTYLDIGCGTGNYLQALTQKGFTFYGVEPSDTMIDIAKEKCPETTFIKGYAEDIPFEDGFFDGGMALFTVHHWSNQQQGLNELARVMKPDGRVVFLSFTGEQMDGYWLAHYFPQMIKKSGELIPSQERKFEMLYEAGFSKVETEKYFIQPDLQDHFLYADKYKPEQYLNPEIRKGTSGFSAFANQEEVAQGLKQLEADIISGKINEIMSAYENDMGDYLFYTAVK